MHRTREEGNNPKIVEDKNVVAPHHWPIARRVCDVSGGENTLSSRFRVGPVKGLFLAWSDSRV